MNKLIKTRNNGNSFELISPTRDIFREMDELFFDALSAFRPTSALVKNWRNNENDYTLELELPRFKKEEITIETQDGYISISAVSSKNTQNIVKNTLNLPQGVDVDKITARLEDGVLYVFVPKSEATKPKFVKVQ